MNLPRWNRSATDARTAENTGMDAGEVEGTGVPHAVVYLYRDGRDEETEQVILHRALDADEVEAVRESLADGERFLPERVDLEDLRWRFDDPDALEDPWHEIDLDAIAPIPGAEPHMTAEEFIARFDGVDWGSSHYSFG